MTEGFLHKLLDKTDKLVEVKVVFAGLNAY